MDTTKEVHLLAASLYRDLRKRGMTVPSADAAIAAVAIHNGFSLFTRDGHFAEIARHSEVQLLA